jgi:hypothetical protein
LFFLVLLDSVFSALYVFYLKNVEIQKYLRALSNPLNSTQLYVKAFEFCFLKHNGIPKLLLSGSILVVEPKAFLCNILCHL